MRQALSRRVISSPSAPSAVVVRHQDLIINWNVIIPVVDGTQHILQRLVRVVCNNVQLTIGRLLSFPFHSCAIFEPHSFYKVSSFRNNRNWGHFFFAGYGILTVASLVSDTFRKLPRTILRPRHGGVMLTVAT